MQHLITRAANTSNILNVELFWHVISGVILDSHILARHSLRFNVLLMCTSPQRSQRATIGCIWLIMHHKVTGALYVDGLIPASSFVPRVCCLWCIQHPVTCRCSHIFYVAFLRGLVCLSRAHTPFSLVKALRRKGVAGNQHHIWKRTPCRSKLQHLLRHSHRKLRARHTNTHYLSCYRLVPGILFFNTTKQIQLENRYRWNSCYQTERDVIHILNWLEKSSEPNKLEVCLQISAKGSRKAKM